MRILVTGAKGQLGQDVVRLFSESHEVFGLSRAELDVTDEAQTRTIVDEVQPDVILHAAAYTAVDKAEEEPEQAYLVNAFGTRNVALAAKSVNAKLCAISTDYVFDGEASIPYETDAETNPQSAYGISKLAGENFVRELMDRYFVVRTSWVFGQHGNNFVKTMLNLGQQGRALRVVNDQIGSPTYTMDLARFLLALVQTDKYGIYHASNTGLCSWYEFAREIFYQVSFDTELSPCATEEFPRPAPRPKYSVMSAQAIKDNGFEVLPLWHDALRVFLAELQKNEKTEV